MFPECLKYILKSTQAKMIMDLYPKIAGLGSSQQLGSLFGLAMGMQGSKVLGPSCSAFPGVSARSWRRSATGQTTMWSSCGKVECFFAWLKCLHMPVKRCYRRETKDKHPFVQLLPLLSPEGI